jgi:HAE1 family hydrophobic/amphiphilic exporter-1
MLLTRFSLRNPIVVTLFFAVVGLLGLTAFVRMSRSLLPPIALPVVAISAPYPGAAPKEIERLVIAPIEEQLRTLPGIDRVTSFAQEGSAEIEARFRFGSAIESDRADVQEAVDAARPNMPADLVPPVVRERDPSQAPVLQEAVTSGVLSSRELTDLVELQIAPALRASVGVGAVVTSGGLTRQLTVAPRGGALAALGGAPLDLVRAVAPAGDVFPGGQLRSPLRESSIGVRSSADSAASLRSLPVSLPSAGTVRIGDVAAVRDDYADPFAQVTVDGDPAILLSVSRAPGANSLAAIASARRTLDALAQRYPLVRFTPLRSDAPYTAAATSGVFTTIAEGIALTVAVMLFFLRAWRNAAIAAIAIPASLCAALAAMWAMGFTIDVLSLMGLSITIGILVDDSIVVIEAISNATKRGLDPDAAALAGRNEVGAAAFAITLVDVAVFAPIAFMSGIVGQFMREFGLVVVFATTCSLIVSFTLTPLLAARWGLRTRAPREVRTLPWMLRTRAARAMGRAARACVLATQRWEGAVGETYATRWLPRAWKRRRGIAATAAAACAAALWLVGSGRIATEFSPPTTAGHASVSLTFPPGTPRSVSAARAQRLADPLLDDDRIRHVVVTSGAAFNGTTDVFAPTVADTEATLDDQTASADPIVARIKSLQPLVPEAQISGAARSMGGTAPVSYNVVGEAGAADVAAARIAAKLRANPFATDVRTSNAGIGPRIDIAIDSPKALLLGVAEDDAAQTARIATSGAIAAKVRTSSGLTNVVVRSDATSRGDLDEALRTVVRASDGRLVPLSDLTTVTPTSEPVVVERENGRRIVSVTANTANSAPIGLVTGPIARKLREPGFLPAGARVEPRGDVEEFLDTARRIVASLALAVLIVYVILAVLYRSYALPFAIMLSVPLASIGAFGALFVTNAPLNLYSMLGIVMLIGLVAKNGILLVEYAEQQALRGETPYAAMLLAARRRFRPIVMTTVAMIAGMLPLALGHAAGAQYRQALGIVVIGGLASSLLLTLFVVPIAYMRYRARRLDRRKSAVIANANATAPMTLAAGANASPTSPSGEGFPDKTISPASSTPKMLSPTINPDATSTPSCFARSGCGRPAAQRL